LQQVADLRIFIVDTRLIHFPWAWQAMKFQIQKWGNSLALRLPKSVASHVGLSQGSEVEVSIEDNRLILTPVSSRRARLEALLDQIQDDQLHPEIETGPPMGHEAW
jgi:antitoxin MazE